MKLLIALLVTLGVFCANIAAQTTAFTYQGRLTDASVPAHASYDMQFRLFDTQGSGTGAQQGSTYTPPAPVSVTNGIFTVELDFGPAVFTAGANLFLEISLRPAGSGGGFTSLGPRQKITSAPYSIRSGSSANADEASNAASLGGVAAYQYVQTSDARLMDARNPLPNSSNYIQNTTTQQALSNFNISGSGTIAGTLKVGATTSVPSSTIVGSGTGGQHGVTGVSGSGAGVFGKATGSGFGIYGESSSGTGVGGTTTNGYGVSGFSTGEGFAVYGSTGVTNGYGVYGVNYGGGHAVHGNALNGGYAIYGDTSTGYGVYGASVSGIGVYGKSVNGTAARFDGQVLVDGFLDVDFYANGGTATVCRLGARLAVCSSSLRYKTAVKPFTNGLDLVNRLRPISFAWKSDGTTDLGLGAEDVAQVEPLLVTHNEKGEVEGVKYDRVAVVLVNAVKEQQAEIETEREKNRLQQGQIELQQRQINALRKLVCKANGHAPVCKEKLR